MIIINRGYAIFILASCAKPRIPNMTRAFEMAKEANLLDPTFEKFTLALKSFYQFAAVREPFHPDVFLLLALCYQCIYQDYQAADCMYRFSFDCFFLLFHVSYCVLLFSFCLKQCNETSSSSIHLKDGLFRCL